MIDGTAALTVTGQPGPANSNSIGMQNIKEVGFTAASPVTARIVGRNLSRVRIVTFVGASPVAIGPSNIKSNGTKIEVGVPAFCVTGAGGSNSVAVNVDDGVNPVVSFANGWIYVATGPIQVFLPNVPLGAVAFLTGPCEDVGVNLGLFQGGFAATDCNFQVPSCVKISFPTVTQHGIESAVFPSANIALFRWTSDCSACLQHGTLHASFPATATNSKSGSGVTVCAPASCTN